MNTQGHRGFSARVRLHLKIDEKLVPLAQVGPNFCILREPFDLPPREADIIADIDDLQHTRRILLVEGISSEQPLTAIRECTPALSTTRREAAAMVS